MTDTKQVIQFYKAAATAIAEAGRSGADKAAALMDAAASVFDNVNEYGPFIVSLAAEEGIAISGKLAEMEAITDEARQRTQKEKEIDTAKKAADFITTGAAEYIKNLDLGHTPEEKEMTEAAAAIAKATANLAAPKSQSRFYSFPDYLADCKNYDPDKDFTPALFGIPFPDGTVSYIGARTSRGKTASMLNLAREALTMEQPRKVLFITLEMSPKQLLTRLALSLIYAKAAATAPAITAELDKREKPMRDYYRLLKDQGIEEGQGGGYQMSSGANYARETIKAALESKSLILFDGRGMELEPLINTMKANAEKGTLILLDYIQRMPSPPEVSDSTYMRVKGISDKVLNTAAATDAVIIAGAQFNRMRKETTPKKTDKDTFDDASFRESGDLEQDAHCAIGLGWYEKKKDTRFFEVLKVRDGEIPKYPIELTWKGAYQYMANSGKPITSDKEETDPAQAPEKTSGPIRGGMKGGKA
jgi:hypothetical protein